MLLACDSADAPGAAALCACPALSASSGHPLVTGVQG